MIDPDDPLNDLENEGVETINGHNIYDAENTGKKSLEALIVATLISVPLIWFSWYAFAGYFVLIWLGVTNITIQKQLNDQRLKAIRSLQLDEDKDEE